MATLSANVSVSPQAADAIAQIDEAFNGLLAEAATAVETPVPQSDQSPPPGFGQSSQFEIATPPARSLQSSMDAANTTETAEVQRAAQIEAANIDEKIADVEAKLNHTIENLNADMDGKLAQIKDSFDRLMSAFAAQLATVNAPPKYTEAAAPAATATHLASYAPAGTLPASSASTAAAAPVAEPVQAPQPDLLPDHRAQGLVAASSAQVGTQSDMDAWAKRLEQRIDRLLTDKLIGMKQQSLTRGRKVWQPRQQKPTGPIARCGGGKRPPSGGGEDAPPGQASP